MKNKILAIILVVGLAMLCACGEKAYAPRPRGYFRIDFPEKTYKQYNGECPFTFEIPEYSYLIKEINSWQKKYLTYRGIDNSKYSEIDTLLNDAHDFAYKHTIKADAIEENIFEKDSSRVYGCLYNIKGNVASQVQFFLTDSTTHFMRGSLYFEARPNKDSLAPVVDFVREDIEHFMESFEWKDSKIQ